MFAIRVMKIAIRVMKIEEVKKHRKPMLLSSKGSVEQYPEGEE